MLDACKVMIVYFGMTKKKVNTTRERERVCTWVGMGSHFSRRVG